MDWWLIILIVFALLFWKQILYFPIGIFTCIIMAGGAPKASRKEKKKWKDRKRHCKKHGHKGPIDKNYGPYYGNFEQCLYCRQVTKSDKVNL